MSNRHDRASADRANGDRAPRPGTVIASGVSPVAGGGVGVAAVAVALAAGTALQASRARRRYGHATIRSGAIDLLAVPPDPTLADGRPIELLALGDSGMAGVGVGDPAEALPFQIASRVAARIGRPVHVVSHAEAGARTHDVLVDQLPAVSDRPDVVVLLIGTNDVIHLTPLRRLAASTTNLLARLHLVGAPVVVSSLPEFGAMRAIPRIVRSAVAARAIMVRRIHREAVLDGPGGVELVDVRAQLGQEFVLDEALMSADRFHPSAAGYSRIADALVPAVVSALGVEGSPGLVETRFLLTPGSAA